MATPTSNLIGFTSVDDAAMPELIYDTKWGGALGTGVTLEFSFVTDASQFLSGYGTEIDDVYHLTDAEKSSVRSALNLISSVVNVSFVERTDSASLNGDIRFGGTYNSDPGAYAHAYYPGGTVHAGDVWFSDEWNPTSGAMAAGSFDFMTILHEMGHALGLKHSFEGDRVLSDTYDNYFYTLMSYTASPWSVDNYASFYPTTLMYYDLVALQALYGRNSSHNAGNTTYTFSDGQTYFQTIDDVSGTDTIRFVGTEMCEISLAAGTFSQLSELIYFDTTTSRFTVAIGPNTIIENAIGGSGNDLISGNTSANTLNGGAGFDTLNGALGHDVLLGAAGNDKLIGFGGNDTLNGGAAHDRMTGGGGADAFVFNSAATAAHSDLVMDFVHNTDKIHLENSVFTGLGAATGALTAPKFWIGANAHDANDRIIYESVTGKLFYDADGTGAAVKALVATLSTGLALTASDFVVI